jgi:ankyrin repeat protein
MLISSDTCYGFFFTTLSSHETLARQLDLIFDSEPRLQHLDIIVSTQNQALIYEAASAWAHDDYNDITIQLLLCPRVSEMEIMVDNRHEGILTAYAYREEDGYTPLSYACAEQLEKVVNTLRNQHPPISIFPR